MHGSFYRLIIKNAFSLTFRNRYLWIFGFFAVFLANMGEYRIIFKATALSVYGARFPLLSDFYSQNIFSLETARNFFSKAVTDPVSFFLSFTLIVLLLLFAGFLAWLSSLSQASIIFSAEQLESSKKSLTFQKSFSEGKKFIFPVFVLNVIYYLLLSILLFLVGLPAYVASVSVSIHVVWLYLFAYFVILPLAIIASLIIRYSLSYAVLKKKDVADALHDGFDLFRRHWLISLEMAGILFVIDMLFIVAAVVLMIFAAMPAFAFGVFLLYTGASTASLVLFILAMFLAFIVLLVFGAYLLCFQYSSWTLLFSRLTKQGAISKIARLFYG